MSGVKIGEGQRGPVRRIGWVAAFVAGVVAIFVPGLDHERRGPGAVPRRPAPEG